MPNFDEERFPFILFDGTDSMSIVNVKEGFIQPLIKQATITSVGSSTFFAKTEEYGISVHWTNPVRNIDGKYETLI